MNREDFKKAQDLDFLAQGTEQNIKTLADYEVDSSFSLAMLKPHLRFIDNGFTVEELEAEFKKQMEIFLEIMVQKCKIVKQEYLEKFEKV